jgi:hypothetical protein
MYPLVLIFWSFCTRITPPLVGPALIATTLFVFETVEVGVEAADDGFVFETLELGNEGTPDDVVG